VNLIPQSLKIRVSTITACVVIATAALASSCAGDTTALPRLPDTTRGIHLAMVFDYAVPAGFRFAGIDAVWSAAQPVRGRTSFYYVPFERDLKDDYSPQWWEANHPDWIEYTCDRRWATEFGHPDAPLDIGNPAVRQWQWSHEILPALQRGYQGIAFDNLNLTNDHDRCGHYDSSGNWVNQYAGPGGLERYQQDVLSWARYMRSQLHKYGRLMGINYSYTPVVSWSLNLSLMSLPDLLFDEAGVTNNGVAGDNVASGSKWQLIFRAARQVQGQGVCYELNGEEPQETRQIPLDEREWIIANYLLIKGRCTFVYITGYRVDPSQSNPVGPGDLVQDYGDYYPFPEYRLRVGSPLAPARSLAGLWSRPYTGGLVLVNPTDSAHGFRTRGPRYALGSFSRGHRFVVAAHGALILLNRPGG
jgi:hypothetical protein